MEHKPFRFAPQPGGWSQSAVWRYSSALSDTVECKKAQYAIKIELIVLLYCGT